MNYLELSINSMGPEINLFGINIPLKTKDRSLLALKLKIIYSVVCLINPSKYPLDLS